MKRPSNRVRGWSTLAGLALLTSTVVGTSLRDVQRTPTEPSASAVPRGRVRPLQIQTTPVAAHAAPALPSKAFLDTYCITCHNQRLKTGGLTLDGLDLSNPGPDAQTWEKVVVKLRAGLMPPTGMPRPAPAVIDSFAGALEASLDRYGAEHPDPGRTEPLHRLNRAEYANAVRDLLKLDIDFTDMLPTDEISYGFDNIAGVLKLSPLLMERYLNTAQKVARLALGTPAPPSGEFYRIPDQLDQDIRLDGMPVGTRGGTRVEFVAPRDGDYDIKVRIGRGIDYDVPHYLGDQPLEISVDGEQKQIFVVPATPDNDMNIERQVARGPDAPPRPRRPTDANGDPIDDGSGRRDLDNDWVVRVPMTAGVHEVRATFIMHTGAVPEGFRKPFLKPYIGRGVSDDRETREGPALRELEIMGPMNPGLSTAAQSYQQIMSCRPARAADEAGCARTILSRLARRAYRRPVTETDMSVLLEFFQQGRSRGSFEMGIEMALQRMLVSPSFLFRTELAPATASAADATRAYRISDLELASRLSFFLWSSIPDDQLLDLAIANKLHEPAVLDRETKRMLADPKSSAFTENFAGQWLSLRRLPDIVPDPYLFPDYGDTLALAFKREAELFFDSIVRDDRPTLDLLTANYTFVNERLAKHYEIPSVKGINFQRVTLPPDSPRIGLLGKGAILVTTALPNRTSPVVRGKWVLQNVLGAPPPEPPPDVPALQENGNQISKTRTTRERLEAHRANTICASCHKLMDPIGFALESFDAVGRYRVVDENFAPIDNSGVYADGTPINGLAGLRQVLMNHPDQVMVNMTRTLMTYALGRGVEHYDMPAVRGILREGAPQNYRFSTLILGIVKSTPFQMRRSDS